MEHREVSGEQMGELWGSRVSGFRTRCQIVDNITRMMMMMVMMVVVVVMRVMRMMRDVGHDEQMVDDWWLMVMNEYYYYYGYDILTVYCGQYTTVLFFTLMIDIGLKFALHFTRSIANTSNSFCSFSIVTVFFPRWLSAINFLIPTKCPKFQSQVLVVSEDSSTIMEVENHPEWRGNYYWREPIFRFHDCGRKAIFLGDPPENEHRTWKWWFFNRNLLFQGIIFGFHVSFRGGYPFNRQYSLGWMPFRLRFLVTWNSGLATPFPGNHGWSTYPSGPRTSPKK